MRARSIVCLAAVCGVLAWGARLVAADAPKDVQVKTSVDRTAVWVGDRIVYTIDLICRPNVDILDDDLSKDHLKLEGLDMLATDTSQQDTPDGGKVHRFRYTLATLRVDTPTLKIAPLTVRYFNRRPGQRIQDAAPAGEVAVPGVAIAFRSMLSDPQDANALRDGRVAAPRAAWLAHAQGIGAALVLVSLAPAAFWMVGVVRRRPRVVRKSKREVREEERASLEAARALDLSSPDARREAYGHMNTIVREHLREICGVAGPALTPSEIAPALARGHARMPAEEVVALLSACEVARYATPDALPPADACRDALDRTEQILAVR